MLNWFKKPTLSDFDSSLTRERMIQAGRLAVIDDESPLIIDELRKVGFAVDHDEKGDDLKNYDNQIYDVVIVDYHGVGQHFGAGQGLELVRHIRRVSPRTRVIAFTSRSLSATESEFFRLSHVVLPKDLGLGESLALIERELGKAFAKEHLFEAMVEKISLKDPAEKAKLQAQLVSALAKKDPNRLRQYVSKIAGVAAEKSVEIIISKFF